MNHRLHRLARALAGVLAERGGAGRLTGRLLIPAPEHPFDFDQLAREMAEGLSRREALRRLGVGLACAAFSCLGLGAKAWAAPSACNTFCNQKQYAGRAHRQCIEACLACGANPDYLCGPPGGLICTSDCPSGPNAAPVCSDMVCGITCASGWGNCDGIDNTGCEVNLLTDADNCGYCRNMCPEGVNATRICSNGQCGFLCNPGFADCEPTVEGCETDITTVSNCGACGRACNFAHGVAECRSGDCVLVACQRGWANCDGIDANGCEQDIATDPNHCGACGRACDPGERCVNGVCVCGNPGVVCADGRVCCGGVCVDPDTDVQNCGACGNACPSYPNSVAVCTNGTCGYACIGYFADCNGIASDGCEVDTRTDLQNCGACFRPCSFHAGVAACVNGDCVLVACESGWANCDGNDGNGCEQNITTDPNHCGACGRICPAPENGTATCVNGVCGAACQPGFHLDGGLCCPEGSYNSNGVCCPTGRTNCGGACVDLLTDQANCGACDSPCVNDGRTTRRCDNGVCCETHLTNCGGVCRNLAFDSNNCNACGNVCPSGTICCSSSCVEEKTHDHCEGCSPCGTFQACIDGTCIGI